MAESVGWFLGIDWGQERHAWCLMDQTGRVIGTRMVPHTAAAVHEAVQWVRTQTAAAPAEIGVAIERPDGVLVDTLLAVGWAVFAINPKQLDRFRDRFTVAGAKDDQRDAEVAADALRTDARAFRRVQAHDPHLLELRELCRILDEVTEQLGRLTNRLREQLNRVDGAWLTVTSAADAPWLWAILAKLPHPAQWPRIGVGRLQTVLRQHRIRRIAAADLREALRAPRLQSAPGVADAVALHIRALVPHLQLLATQRATTQQQIDHALEALAGEGEADTTGEHRDVVILRSLPGVGRVVTATMLTEAAGPLAARDYATLRAHSGVAPITKRSGKSLWHVHMRYACNPRLRQALYHWARASLCCDRRTRAYYDTLRARGHRHGRALRSVADRWLRILIAMLRQHALYDPTRYAAHAVATV